MPFANYIYEYFSGIQSGKYTVGKWVRLIYEIIIAGLERGEYFFNAKKANKAIKFIENFCHHCEGREDLLKLEVWQKACVSVIFGIVDADGLRVFREVFIVIGRKNGKTLSDRQPVFTNIRPSLSFFAGSHGKREVRHKILWPIHGRFLFDPRR